MYAHVVSLGVTGLDGYPVTVETHISGGLPKFAMVGLPDSAVKESSERVRSAIKNLNCPWPASHVTIYHNRPKTAIIFGNLSKILPILFLFFRLCPLFSDRIS